MRRGQLITERRTYRRLGRESRKLMALQFLQRLPCCVHLNQPTPLHACFHTLEELRAGVQRHLQALFIVGNAGLLRSADQQCSMTRSVGRGCRSTARDSIAVRHLEIGAVEIARPFRNLRAESARERHQIGLEATVVRRPVARVGCGRVLPRRRDSEVRLPGFIRRVRTDRDQVAACLRDLHEEILRRPRIGGRSEVWLWIALMNPLQQLTIEQARFVGPLASHGHDRRVRQHLDARIAIERQQ